MKFLVFLVVTFTVIFKSLNANEVTNEILDVDKDIDTAFGDFFKNGVWGVNTLRITL